MIPHPNIVTLWILKVRILIYELGGENTVHPIILYIGFLIYAKMHLKTMNLLDLL